MTSASSYEHLILALESTHNTANYINGVSVLIRILDNIIAEPHNDKYRTIRRENKVVKEKLLALSGVRELLHAIGFVEINGALSLPATVLIVSVRQIRDQLKRRMDAVGQSGANELPGTSKAAESTAVRKHPTTIIPLQSFADRTNFERVVPYANAFLQHMEDRSDQVQQYEDERLQHYGRQLVPVQQLTEYALLRMRAIQKQQKADPSTGGQDPHFDDMFLVELTRWFHDSFFEWVNSLPCRVCNEPTKGRRVASLENGFRVEVLHCCNTQTKFHRYNDIAQLLLTRKGRCGEYASCFTFLCRSLGYDARLVYATFDHVWTEVYSDAQNRWIHVDPSDNVIDAPMMYQHGWKRKIDYIIAYSNEDVDDLTWRYTNNHGEILRNRTNCSESDLMQTILLLRQKRQKNVSTARMQYIKKRLLHDIVESMNERQPTENELRGRSSGSMSWRTARGEKDACSTNNFYVFNADNVETTVKQFNVRYSCVTDTYERYTRQSSSRVQVHDRSSGWQSCVCRWERIARKEERDWKMVYLARAEDTDTAQIIWNFDFSTANLRIKQIKLVFDTKIYENGQVNLEISHKGKILPSIDNVRNLSSFALSAKLSGGKGDCAWQHTQLFRQSMSAANEYPFAIEIIFH